MTDLRKALVSPNEDFVVMVPATNQDKTRIIGEDDLKQIKEEADSLYLKADQAVHARAEEMKRYDEDEDDAEDEDDDELEDEDDGDLNPKMEKAITIMGIVAAVVIVIIIIVIVANLFGGIKSKKQSDTETSRTETTQTESQNEDKVTVPDFRGMTYADAQTKAEKNGLKLENKGKYPLTTMMRERLPIRTRRAAGSRRGHDDRRRDQQRQGQCGSAECDRRL